MAFIFWTNLTAFNIIFAKEREQVSPPTKASKVVIAGYSGEELKVYIGCLETKETNVTDDVQEKICQEYIERLKRKSIEEVTCKRLDRFTLECPDGEYKKSATSYEGFRQIIKKINVESPSNKDTSSYAK